MTSIAKPYYQLMSELRIMSSLFGCVACCDKTSHLSLWLSGACNPKLPVPVAFNCSPDTLLPQQQDDRKTLKKSYRVMLSQKPAQKET